MESDREALQQLVVWCFSCSTRKSRISAQHSNSVSSTSTLVRKASPSGPCGGSRPSADRTGLIVQPRSRAVCAVASPAQLRTSSEKATYDASVSCSPQCIGVDKHIRGSAAGLPPRPRRLERSWRRSGVAGQRFVDVQQTRRPDGDVRRARHSPCSGSSAGIGHHASQPGAAEPCRAAALQCAAEARVARAVHQGPGSRQHIFRQRRCGGRSP